MRVARISTTANLTPRHSDAKLIFQTHHSHELIMLTSLQSLSTGLRIKNLNSCDEHPSSSRTFLQSPLSRSLTRWLFPLPAQGIQRRDTNFWSHPSLHLEHSPLHLYLSKLLRTFQSLQRQLPPWSLPQSSKPYVFSSSLAHLAVSALYWIILYLPFLPFAWKGA